MKRRSNAQTEETEINMTPMLDIVFIMLIFFIVTSTFVKEPGIDVTRPEAVTAEQTRPAILVAIQPDGEVWIDGAPVELDSVRVIVEQLHAENPKGGVVVQADVLAENGVLIDVINQINLVDVPDVFVSALQEG